MDINDMLTNTYDAIIAENIGHARHLLHSMRAIVESDNVILSLVVGAISDLNHCHNQLALNDVKTAKIVNTREAMI